VRHREIPPATIVELLDAVEVLADRIAVFDADEGDLAPAGVDFPRVGRGQGKPDLVRRDLLAQPMDRVELLDRLRLRSGVSLVS
jgi:hypothetical protein